MRCYCEGLAQYISEAAPSCSAPPAVADEGGSADTTPPASDAPPPQRAPFWPVLPLDLSVATCQPLLHERRTAWVSSVLVPYTLSARAAALAEASQIAEQSDTAWQERHLAEAAAEAAREAAQRAAAERARLQDISRWDVSVDDYVASITGEGPDNSFSPRFCFQIASGASTTNASSGAASAIARRPLPPARPAALPGKRPTVAASPAKGGAAAKAAAAAKKAPPKKAPQKKSTAKKAPARKTKTPPAKKSAPAKRKKKAPPRRRAVTPSSSDSSDTDSDGDSDSSGSDSEAEGSEAAAAGGKYSPSSQEGSTQNSLIASIVDRNAVRRREAARRAAAKKSKKARR